MLLNNRETTPRSSIANKNSRHLYLQNCRTNAAGPLGFEVHTELSQKKLYWTEAQKTELQQRSSIPAPHSFHADPGIQFKISLQIQIHALGTVVNSYQIKESSHS
jgi:hypothetical protein